MLAFLESHLVIDASGLNFSEMPSVSAGLTLDNRSAASIDSFTVTVPPNSDGTIPFSASMTKTGQTCILKVTFDKPVENIGFNLKRNIKITANTGDFCDFTIEINYANSFVPNDWKNISNTNALDDIDSGAPLNSKSINDRFMGLIRISATALNKATVALKLYAFKNKSLPDIIDFALMAGTCPLPATASIARNSNGDISTCVTTYSDPQRGIAQKIRINYNYASGQIIRCIKRNGSYLDQESTPTSLLNSITISALDSNDAVIYSLGSIIFARTQSVISIPYLKDYDAGLPAEKVQSDPDNILSNYKYYKTSLITGWTVSV